MKKVLSILLVLVIALSLCACGGNTSKLSSEEKSVVGEWEGYRNFVLTPSGRGLKFTRTNLGVDTYKGTEITWEIYDGMLYIYKAGSDESQRYAISGENLLGESGQILSTKK